MRLIMAMLAMTAVSAAQAQAPAGQAVADAATFGAVAALAPLCGLRDGTWAADLRRAALQATTGSAATDDAALVAAPGGNQGVAALGYGDMEALEDFAADKPDATCSALRRNPALQRADAAVASFRQRRDGKPDS